MYNVRKKDGSTQPFDRSKVLSGVLKAGGSAEEAEQVAVAIEAWLPTVAVEGVVNSPDIRTKVLEVLKTINPTAATNFESYQKQPQPEPTLPPQQ